MSLERDVKVVMTQLAKGLVSQLVACVQVIRHQVKLSLFLEGDYLESVKLSLILEEPKLPV